MKIFKRILVFMLVVLIALQFYRPEKNSGEYRDVKSFEIETKPSKEVAAILESKCYDCHSNKTEYPWYAEVAPVSFWINGHVEEGNEHFNASSWGTYDYDKKNHKLEELIEEVEEGHMPEKPYTWIHGNLYNSEKELLLAWAREARIQLAN